MFSSQYPVHFGVCFSTDTLVYSSILPFTECVPLFSTRSTLRAASVAAQASISSASSSSAVCSSSYFCISADIRRHLAEPQSQGRGWSVRKRTRRIRINLNLVILHENVSKQYLLLYVHASFYSSYLNMIEGLLY